VPLRCVLGYLVPVTEPTNPQVVARRPPPFRLPAPRRRPGGVVASVVLHSLILLLLVRYGVQWITGGADAAGDRGGGGGGSGSDARYVQLPTLAPAAAAAAPPPVAHTVELPAPVPVKSETPVPDEPFAPPPVAPTPVSPAAGAGAGGGPGQGPGSAGGTGGGTGGGVGNDSGPGRVGDGEYITPPYARTVLLPATCARGRFTVRFWVETDGHVSRVTVEPLPKGGGCRQEMQDKMMGYQFLPAHTRDGRPVASVTEVHLQQ